MEDRQAKRLVDDSLMEKLALQEVSNESRGGWRPEPKATESRLEGRKSGAQTGVAATVGD